LVFEWVFSVSGKSNHEETGMILLAVLFGVIVAIFINGLADNLPELEGRIHSECCIPRCSYCHAPRKASDWLALLALLFRGGGCARCGAPRAFRDLLVEAVLSLGISTIWLMGISLPVDFLISTFLLSSFLLMTIIDLEHRYVLSELLLIFPVVYLLGIIPHGGAAIVQILIGGGIGLVIFLALYLLGMVLARITRLGEGIEPLGLGDVFLAGIVGMATGWPSILLAVVLSILMGGLSALIIIGANILRRKSTVNVTMAYGPYLLISGIIVHFAAGEILGNILQWIY
jgi:leader peptidase (prepilin peptidase)/N-methyltransferase